MVTLGLRLRLIRAAFSRDPNRHLEELNPAGWWTHWRTCPTRFPSGSGYDCNCN